MPLAVRGVILGVDEPEELLPAKAAARLKVRPEDIRVWAIVRRSIDARDKSRLGFSYNLEVALHGPELQEAKLVRRLHRADVALLEMDEPPEPQAGEEPLLGRPVVVGFGPAGMMAGYMLAAFGYRPLIIDRGRDVSTRHRDIMVEFYQHGRFNGESNLLFGEGGAGTYSDGKLYTRVHDRRVRTILELFYQHGANPDILIDGKPHIGSDKLPGICRRIRLDIEAMGGEVRFGARLDDAVVESGRLSAVVVNGERIACGPVILAVGHSARDSLRMLSRHGVKFVPKPFQLGVRIEHPQTLVDRWQYGERCGQTQLPPADYHLVAKGAAGRYGDLFSFCMCPGGVILPTNESPGLIATNGASRSKRDGAMGNAGLVITLDPVNVCAAAADDPLAAFDYLEAIERAAFESTGGTYHVPCQRATDFLAGRISDGAAQTTYPLGGAWRELRDLLPPAVWQSLTIGLGRLDSRMPGFAGPEAIITAPETRASGPIRVLRDRDTRESVSTAGLYPVGEGAGYAGGIISAGIDGLKTAEVIIGRYAPESGG